MKVTVVWATRSVQDLVELDLPAGSTLGDAVAQSGLIEQHRIDPSVLGFAIYGRRSASVTVLAEGDRVELTRPLEADPKLVRAARARRGSRSRSVRGPPSPGKPDRDGRE